MSDRTHPSAHPAMPITAPTGADDLPHPDHAPSLRRLGLDERVATWFAGCPSGSRLARVVRVERGGAVVAFADGEHLVRSTAGLAVGDWASLRPPAGTADETPGALAVDAVAPRHSQLTRLDPEGFTQVLAANVDLVLVAAPADRLSPARVERETAVAWSSGAIPLVLVTKADLAAPGLVADLTDRLIGVEVVATSAVTGEGAERVAQVLRPGRTAALLGPSGAGKSSLANRLLGSDSQTTGQVREADRRGRHVTTSRHLLVVPSGGVLIDTPGLRSLALADGEGVAAAFPDVEDLASACRFTDCRHESEPGCAVVAALDEGRLDPERLRSFRKLERELAYEVRRSDPLARREAQRVWTLRTREGRRRSRPS